MATRPATSPKPEAVDFRSYAFTNQIVVSFVRPVSLDSVGTYHTTTLKEHGKWLGVMVATRVTLPVHRHRRRRRCATLLVAYLSSYYIQASSQIG